MEQSSSIIDIGRLLMNELDQVNRVEKYFNTRLKSLLSDHPDIENMYTNIGNIYVKKNHPLIVLI
jgi:hypothetical protein